MKTYYVSITCAWVEEIRADSMEEALKKMEEKYKYGKGRFPREYVDVDPFDGTPWCMAE